MLKYNLWFYSFNNIMRFLNKLYSLYKLNLSFFSDSVHLENTLAFHHFSSYAFGSKILQRGLSALVKHIMRKIAAQMAVRRDKVKRVRVMIFNGGK